MFQDANEALYKWYMAACYKNIYLAGPQLIEKAKQIADSLGKPEFKGSNGWLTKWKTRYNIKKVKSCGESGDMHGETVQSWKERLPEILHGFSKEDIWNADETGVVWRTLPETGFGQKGKTCSGGRKSKQRITVAFFVTASGVKEKPIVIWHSENPRCMKRFDKTVLHVAYYSQKYTYIIGERVKRARHYQG